MLFADLTILQGLTICPKRNLRTVREEGEIYYQTKTYGTHHAINKGNRMHPLKQIYRFPS